MCTWDDTLPNFKTTHGTGGWWGIAIVDLLSLQASTGEVLESRNVTFIGTFIGMVRRSVDGTVDSSKGILNAHVFRQVAR